MRRNIHKPVRSNIFQRLVAELHRDLSPGWHICESRELEDFVTGAPREVDVVIEGVIAGYPTLLCIEVRDRGRPADVSETQEPTQTLDRMLAGRIGTSNSSADNGGKASPLARDKSAFGNYLEQKRREGRL